MDSTELCFMCTLVRLTVAAKILRPTNISDQTFAQPDLRRNLASLRVASSCTPVFPAPVISFVSLNVSQLTHLCLFFGNWVVHFILTRISIRGRLKGQFCDGTSRYNCRAENVSVTQPILRSQ